MNNKVKICLPIENIQLGTICSIHIYMLISTLSNCYVENIYFI